jgi:hypothetical protein
MIAAAALAVAAALGVPAPPAAAADVCRLTTPSDGVIAPDGKSVTFTVPTILSSAPSAAAFQFSVQNVGPVATTISITESPPLSPPFAYLPVTPGAQFTIAPGAVQTIGAGVRWSRLSNADLGTSRVVTWTVLCTAAVPPTPTPTPTATATATSSGTASATASPGGSVAGASSKPTLRPTASVRTTVPPRPFVTLPATDTLPGLPLIRHVPSHVVAIVLLLAGVACFAILFVLKRRRRRVRPERIDPDDLAAG